MIQNGTFLSVVDNSGAKFAACIKILSGYRSRYAGVGDVVLVSIKNLRTKRRSSSKIKKGEIYHALVIRTVKPTLAFQGDSFQFFNNSVVLLNKQKKFIGTRVFGAVPKNFRNTKFLKILSLSPGSVS
jgi:large subunit ribosomal protein L14